MYIKGHIFDIIISYDIFGNKKYEYFIEHYEPYLYTVCDAV